jgi:hypothetical protein
MERKLITQYLNSDISSNLEGDQKEIIAFLEDLDNIYPGYRSFQIKNEPDSDYTGKTFSLYGIRLESDTEYNKRVAIQKKKDLAKLKRVADKNGSSLTEVEKFRVKYSLPENISLEELKTELNKLPH